jgi:hypothetical protein
VRPFGPELFDAAAGEHRKGWPMRFNAMEVLNSSATQTDIHRLFLDWMSLLNRGYRVTPVGSSDSHDVARHFVGQGRTYIRCDDTDPGHIDVDDAVSSFLQGKVLVSYGLIVELTVDGKYRSGELVPQGDGPVTVNLRVLGPRWVRATHVTLYRNGSAIREQQLGDEPDRELPAGVQWQATWTLPRLEHDSHLVAMVLGDGIEQPFWKTAKAYQPTSQHWEPHTIACSGAVWIDADGDGQPTSAHEYADRLAAQSKGDLRGLMSLLQNYDQAIAAQAAYRLLTGGQSFESEQMQFALKTAAPHVQAGFRAIGQLNATNKFCDSPGRLDDGK